MNDDRQDETTQGAPSFVPDEAASAGTDKPAIAADDAGADVIDGEKKREVRVPDDFAVDDAITKTAIDPPQQ